MYIRINNRIFITVGIIIVLVVWLLIVIFVLSKRFASVTPSSPVPTQIDVQKPMPASDPSNVFVYSFNETGTLYETGKMNQSTSPYWWLDSGAVMNIAANVGRTNFAELPAANYWRLLYSQTNGTDTDDGYHPQNIFRLVSRTTWHNVRQELYFMVDADRLSASTRRDESNGLLLFSRYRDSDNLYYAGLRVDGYAVIKKKSNGVYYTLGMRKVLNGNANRYDRSLGSNFLPKHTWIGIKMETISRPDGQVDVLLYTDVGKTGIWTMVLDARDDGKSFGGPVINDTSHVGIRTDFMDVSFSSYRAEEIR